MKFPRTLLIGGAAAAALLQVGCATITRGSSEQLLVQSEPSSAQVRISNGFTGVTPVSFTVPRKGDLVITVSKDGYETAQMEVKSSLSGSGTAGFLGNALIGGIIGGGIDVATGATLSHQPNPVKVTLRPIATKAPEPAAPVAPVATQSPVTDAAPTVPVASETATGNSNPPSAGPAQSK